jgi:hypothetical protein
MTEKKQTASKFTSLKDKPYFDMPKKGKDYDKKTRYDAVNYYDIFGINITPTSRAKLNSVKKELNKLSELDLKGRYFDELKGRDVPKSNTLQGSTMDVLDTLIHGPSNLVKLIKFEMNKKKRDSLSNKIKELEKRIDKEDNRRFEEARLLKPGEIEKMDKSEQAKAREKVKEIREYRKRMRALKDMPSKFAMGGATHLLSPNGKMRTGHTDYRKK